MAKIITAKEAARLVKSGDCLAINGFLGNAYPDSLSAALEERFLEEKQPQGLTLWVATAQGSIKSGRVLTNRLCYEGLLKKTVFGHYESNVHLVDLVNQEKIEAYNLPQGVISHLYRAAAGRKPGIITTIGLKTFIDPRYGGGKLNSSTKEDMVRLIKIDDEEYLFYKSPKIDVCFIRGTTADKKGNVTMEKEAVPVDALVLAQAVKANGGTVICQVERLSASNAKPASVEIPGILIDFLVVDPAQKQNLVEVYNPSYTGELELPLEEINGVISDMLGKSAAYTRSRKEIEWVIARRGAAEIKKGSVVNLGIGVPTLISAVSKEMGIEDNITLTVESGILGGVPAPVYGFGAAFNPSAICSMSTQFDFYDGGGLDYTFVGAAQIDAKGNVNVSQIGSKLIGVGGFINITQSAKNVIFCSTFTGGKSFKVDCENGAVKVCQDGEIIKFKQKVDQISYSGEVAGEKGQRALYVTERCVFELTADGLMLSEIAPGIDLEKDILAKMEFKPIISPNLKIMDYKCFLGSAKN